jgi:hypothetical protein
LQSLASSLKSSSPQRSLSKSPGIQTMITYTRPP